MCLVGGGGGSTVDLQTQRVITFYSLTCLLLHLARLEDYDAVGGSISREDPVASSHGRERLAWSALGSGSVLGLG